MSQHQRLIYLLEQYFHKRHSPAEREELLQLIDSGGYEQEIRDWMDASLQHLSARELSESASGRIFSAVTSPVMTPETAAAKQSPAPVRILYRIIAVAAAACLLLAGIRFWWTGNHLPANNQQTSLAAAQNIAPGKNGAVLTLADGKQLVLDGLEDGTLASQGNTTVIKSNGQLKYNNSGKASGALLYNTLTTQRGNQFSMVLPDGSKVWLNAASSITYPTTFSDTERVVKVSGEAYFEVVHNVKQPFKVQTEKQLIEDIGTSFNINSYKEEGVTKTTLVEGAVKVTETISRQSVVIRPGQQVLSFASGSSLQTNSDLDVTEEVAWKDGLFVFKDASIEAIMRQAARWYDIDVRYEGRIPAKLFGGKMSKNVPLSGFIEVFKFAGINFRISGRSVTITS